MKPKSLVTDEKNKILRLKNDFSKAKWLIYARAGTTTQDCQFLYYIVCGFFQTQVIYTFFSKLFYVYVHLNIFYYRSFEDSFLDRFYTRRYKHKALNGPVK